MSSLPFISHHLFVAAVERERRHHHAKPPPNQTDQESPAHQTISVELPAGDYNFDRSVDVMSGSPLVRQT